MTDSLFFLSHQPLDAVWPSAGVVDPRAGAVVEFNGCVRNHNEDRAVEALEYEAYEALARREGTAIVTQALQQFDILLACCGHRVGRLDIGDTAICVRVQAAHRRDALRACEFIIDQVKHRLPIWKKEHYAGGDSGWVNCRHCAVTATS